MRVLAPEPERVHNLTVSGPHTYYAGEAPVLVHNAGCPKDFQTKNTVQRSAMLASEGEARSLARTKLGSDPIEVEPHKLRSRDGRWQYRAKPGDVSRGHVHLEQLDARTGEVLRNTHLRWKEPRR